MLTPWQMLAIALAILLMIWITDRVFSRTRSRRMVRFAKMLHMRYSACDRFNIASRIARSIPNQHVDAIIVRDLMYRSSSHGYHYVFTLSYQHGELSDLKRYLGVVSADEPLGRSCENLSNLQFADRKKSIPEQYASLIKHENAPDQSTSMPATESSG